MMASVRPDAESGSGPTPGTAAPEGGVPSDGAAPLVSIIMPCYNVEAYLPAAIASVRAQTFPDWELICVDDASPDGVATLAASAAEEDARIRLVRHERNLGLAGARNTGLAHARGSYVWCADPDDLFDPDLLERAVAALAAEPSDAVFFGIREEYLDPAGGLAASRDVLPPHEGRFEGDALRAIALDLEEATLLGYVTTKVLRRAALSDLTFEDVPVLEDFFFSRRVMDRIESAHLLARAPYRYLKRGTSSITDRFIPRYFELHRRRIQELWDQQRRWGLADGAVRARLGRLFARYVFSALERNCDARSGLDRAGRRAWCRGLLADPLFRELVLGSPATGTLLGALAAGLLKTRSPSLYLAAGRALHICRTRLGRCYVALKMRR